MSNIVKQLRDNAPADHGLASGNLMRKAADEIERLRTVLREIAGHRDETGWGETYSAQVARIALEKNP